MFFICTITQFSVSRCPCLTKQLTTHYPIGFKLHHVSYLTPSFQLKQSTIYSSYTEDLGLWSRVKIIIKTERLKINNNVLLLIQLRVYLFCFVVSCRTQRSKLSSDSQLPWHTLQVLNHATLTCFTQSLTSHYFHAFQSTLQLSTNTTV